MLSTPWLAADDKPICAAGAFNKILEKLQGVHPSCEIVFITKELASLKLPKVVVEEVTQYLNEMKKDLTSFADIVNSIAAKGLQIIYSDVKDKVFERMFGEFGSLYRDRSDPAFIALIDTGIWVEIPNIKVMQNELTNKNLKSSGENLEQHRLQAIKAAILAKARENKFQFGFGFSYTKHSIDDDGITYKVPRRIELIFNTINDHQISASEKLNKIKEIQRAAPDYQSGILFLGRTQQDTNDFICGLQTGT
ncbi:hypothetical protein Psal006b_00822 [Piscirickettsia salmonis]|uniref:50S ribosomal protein L13 n=1 Tax=Piscirickettsia salmonis TaxID=1238 RepID=A0AAC8VJB0_PISSA|nr:hypothetical protein [Piscirickettsia salmonis]AKP74566.1 hypothetical protein PSLF89_3048 [Piscirickettsia salmonis LF-89 = ATCC VR-1361]ALB23557.1 50S ribosomal protein L13 [Piscirickettsia salmonis]ALY03425.1 hypothetical protein AWE47_11680 [Piscirickettsia salmonis]AMA42989.1 hypothetical protein AWJ11_11905 [Piscirickettsia salmonis]AOS35459.1 hypothetical protein AVM72_09035 [Piscirickettsia salmonis]